MTDPREETNRSDPISKELLRAVRRLSLRTRRLLGGPWSGLYRSRLRGRGLAFEEVRPYQPGDDVRSLDAKVTARTGEAYVKRFAEERERVAWLLVDQSPSMAFGSIERTKAQAALETAALLALSAAVESDRIGLVTFGRTIHRVAPERGRRHALRIVRDLLLDQSATPTSSTLSDGVETLRRAAHGRSVIFVLSDLLDDDALHGLRRLRHRHELFVLQPIDPLERRLPKRGLIRFQDAETGRVMIVDSGSDEYRQAHADHCRRRERRLQRDLSRMGADWVPLPTDVPVSTSLLKHFSSASRRRTG
ncbi:hypothetical protein Pan216_24600 [Planctomycetes bacterium Pan216]|uniref:VWFA domain-containing protein n=1 Tax=Kolteria novifilia TaxID=2527975 RepID=A0A518B3N0_9BACT|nr:hypothetical protein Pan216_24600 [Planctomycetes bacterium Pan216]